MKLGICLPHYGRPIEVGRMLEVARRAEERGLDSVGVTDHVIVPEQANVIYREDMLDPLAVLPWLAGVTHRVALGTSVVILPYRSPIPVAKLLASVDVLSGGRLIVGAAIGWLEGEFEALGVPFKERVSRSEEALELFRTLWTQAHPKIETKRYRLHDVSVSPMPLQKPRPPLYVGGNSQAAVDMALIRGRHVITGTVAKIAEDLRGFRALGCGHIALEVSYSTYPAIHDTIDIIAERLRPQVVD